MESTKFAAMLEQESTMRFYINEFKHEAHLFTLGLLKIATGNTAGIFDVGNAIERANEYTDLGEKSIEITWLPQNDDDEPIVLGKIYFSPRWNLDGDADAIAMRRSLEDSAHAILRGMGITL